jgi:hypothetical protein
LLATVGAGTACAVLAGAFEATLAGSLVVAFFLTMVLGLNESVSMQSMTLTIQALRVNTLTRRWFLNNLRREIVTALLLGVACGLLVSAIVWLWRRDANGAAVVGGSIAVSLVTACLFGFSVPSLLHWLKLDPKIAVGPVTLAITDFFMLAFYFLARVAAALMNAIRGSSTRSTWRSLVPLAARTPSGRSSAKSFLSQRRSMARTHAFALPLLMDKPIGRRIGEIGTDDAQRFARDKLCLSEQSCALRSR